MSVVCQGWRHFHAEKCETIRKHIHDNDCGSLAVLTLSAMVLRKWFTIAGLVGFHALAIAAPAQEFVSQEFSEHPVALPATVDAAAAVADVVSAPADALVQAPVAAIAPEQQAPSTFPMATRIIDAAMDKIGIPYRRGGTSAQAGFDCSGLVHAIYAQAAGYALPRVAHDQAKATQKIDKKELQPGDLVFFNTMRRAFSHVGIYMGNGQFIHAPSRGKRVRIENMKDSYWTKRFNGARRVLVEAGHNDSISAVAEQLLHHADAVR